MSGKIPKTSIYPKGQIVSFGFYVHEIQDHAGVSIYPSQKSFHGNLTNGGYITGTYNDHIVNIHSSDSGNSASVSY